MVTILKILVPNPRTKPYQLGAYTAHGPESSTKKGFTSYIARKPLYLLVGTIGFEPTTSTVSG